MISPKNDNDNCFQYAITVASNYEVILKDLQRITRIKLFIDNCSWKEIRFHHTEKIPKSLNVIISQLLLMFCLLRMIKKK